MKGKDSSKGAKALHNLATYQFGDANYEFVSSCKGTTYNDGGSDMEYTFRHCVTGNELTIYYSYVHNCVYC